MKWARVARTNSIVPVYMFEHEKIAAWCSSCWRLLSPPRPRHVCGHEQSFPASVVPPRNHTQANHQNSPVDIHSVGYLARGLHPHHKVSSTDKPSMSFSSDGPLMDNKACKKDHITAKTYPSVEGRHKYPSRHRRPWRPEKVHNNTTRRWEHSEHNNLAQREPIIVCFTTSRPMFPATSTNDPVPVGRCLSQHVRKAPVTAEQHSDNAEVISSCLQATHCRSPFYCRCKARLATLPSAEGALKWSISGSLLGSQTKKRMRNGAAAIRGRVRRSCCNVDLVIERKNGTIQKHNDFP